jgi:hypothetical protein
VIATPVHHGNKLANTQRKSCGIIESVPIKKKVRHRVTRTYLQNGREVVLYPIFGESGKLHRFVMLDRETPIPTHDPERDDVYLRVD